MSEALIFADNLIFIEDPIKDKRHAWNFMNE